MRSTLTEHQVKELVLSLHQLRSLLWHKVNPWPRNFTCCRHSTSPRPQKTITHCIWLPQASCTFSVNKLNFELVEHNVVCHIWWNPKFGVFFLLSMEFSQYYLLIQFSLFCWLALLPFLHIKFTNTHKHTHTSLPLLFLFWQHPQHMEIPYGPGIKSKPEWWPTPQLQQR